MCSLLQHPTSHTLLTSPTPYQIGLVCVERISTAQVVVSQPHHAVPRWRCYWLLKTTQLCRTCVRQHAYPFKFDQTPQSTLSARKILCGQNVTNMVSCQRPTIACNCLTKGSYKTVTNPFGSRVTAYLPRKCPLIKNASFGDRLVEGISFLPTTTNRVFACIVSPRKPPPKWQKNDLVSGGHGQAGSCRGQWTGWIGSAPVQISGCGLHGALSWCGQGEGQSFLVSSWAHCFWQALWVHCTEMHTSRTPPTPCQSLTTTKTLCTHLVWRQKEVMTKMNMIGLEPRTVESQDNVSTNWAVRTIDFITLKCFWFLKSNHSKIQITSFCWERKNSVNAENNESLFTYYLNCVGKSNPVCLIQQLPLVIMLASYVQWLYFLIWSGKIDPFTFSHLC